MEPPEASLAKIQRYRDMAALTYSICSLFSMFLLVSLVLGWSYLSSCWDQWRLLTIAMKLHPEKVPFSRQLLLGLGEHCDESMDGTGTPRGVDACRPSSEQIVEACNHLPANQPEPMAFAKLAERFFGESQGHIFGLRCQQSLCNHHDTLEFLNMALLLIASLLFVFTCCLLKPCANQFIATAKMRESRASRDEHRWSRLESE